MQRDILLLTEMIDAAERAQQLTVGSTVSELETERERRDALLWNFTVLGEAAGQLSAEVKDRFPDIPSALSSSWRPRSPSAVTGGRPSAGGPLPALRGPRRRRAPETGTSAAASRRVRDPIPRVPGRGYCR
jgi:hypothetical protein